MMGVSDDLEGLFPLYKDPARERDWRRVCERLEPGLRVSGTVVASYAFGVYLDLKMGFPAVLTVAEFGPGPLWPGGKPADHPAVGMTIAAVVLELEHDRRLISLTQPGPRHEAGAD